MYDYPKKAGVVMNLKDAQIGEEYIIKEIVTEDEELEAFLPACGTNPDTVVETEHFKQVVNDFLRKQSRDARIFFIRRYWYGEKTSEIAKDCSVSEAKVKTSLFRTRQYFGEVLRK